MENKLFKAIIRVVKSVSNNQDVFGFYPTDVVREPIIEAIDKDEVKSIILSKYPQFFTSGKVYEKETKDKAQFFYVIIFPLYKWEEELIKEGVWTCASCGHVHENKYLSKPESDPRLLGVEYLFCKSDEHVCIENYKKEKFAHIDLLDDPHFIKKDSPNYIYRVTEKATGKCYVGKTRNAPFFRWWNHLTQSSSPFGLHLRKTKLSEWTFEVLEELPCNASDKDVFSIETRYINQFDSIVNGFNKVVSNKEKEETGVEYFGDMFKDL